jgi:hypothetical protein
MKKFEYKEMDLKGFNIDMAALGRDLASLGQEGWGLCTVADNYWIFKREISDKDVHIGLLVSCAYMRGVGNLQHRTIGEFAQFVESVMKGEFPKYEFDWNGNDAIETWIEKFHEHCDKQYKEISLRMSEESISGTYCFDENSDFGDK